jgi:hypothetical protein
MADSDEDLPLITRRKPGAPAPEAPKQPANRPAPSQPRPAAPKPPPPAAPKPAAAPAAAKPAAAAQNGGGSGPSTSGQKRAPPPPPPPAANGKAKRVRDESDEESSSSGDSSSSEESSSGSSGDEDDNLPLAKRRGTPVSGAKGKAASKPAAKRSRSDGEGRAAKPKAGKGAQMWKVLRHSGVLFPPEYEPHGVRVLYDGRPVDLTPDQEEVATMFAVMKETDYMSKPVFLKNFWEGFKEVLGPKHAIKSLDKCDFTPIYDWHMAQRELKKLQTKEVRFHGLVNAGAHGLGQPRGTWAHGPAGGAAQGFLHRHKRRQGIGWVGWGGGQGCVRVGLGMPASTRTPLFASPRWPAPCPCRGRRRRPRSRRSGTRLTPSSRQRWWTGAWSRWGCGGGGGGGAAGREGGGGGRGRAHDRDCKQGSRARSGGRETADGKASWSLAKAVGAGRPAHHSTGGRVGLEGRPEDAAALPTTSGGQG